MMGFNLIGLIFIPIYLLLPALLLYFIIKLAVKHAIQESREENRL
jgi:hypothetical protein